MTALVDTDTLKAKFKACVGRFASGVTVVSYKASEGARGLTVNSFASVSLDPPLVLVSIDRRARAHALLAGNPFTVNVLKPEHEALARRFAGVNGLNGTEPVPWIEGTLSPRLDGALAHLECKPWGAYDGGDHTIYVGKVIDLGYDDEADALGFFCSRFVPIPRPLRSQPPVPYNPFELPYDAL